MSDLARLILLQDVLTLALVAHACWALRLVFGKALISRWIVLAPVATLLWGALWSYVPALGAMRLAPPPLGQAGVILIALIGLSALWLGPHVRHRTGQFDPTPLLGMAVWRMVFGMSVLAVGVAGGLPASFYWSVGLGDILVGLVGGALLLKRRPATPSQFRLWNLLGLADLSHVLVLGAITLIPFFTANAHVPFVNLLPLTGVPLLLSLHILALRYRPRRAAIV
ncbi:hypothetical protein [Roseibaca sp. Y0-43]|uniref:hypothetical protein n=1 Tax=Roseibaca sp. Y0-43 TaxID=2816854 RepID=UPI001D0CDCEA|nr:hypothetical protein [Roseibaca sp. Y0-43]MCC1480442.1 hypothetical protein [Roseibaca sp. Y0-43]